MSALATIATAWGPDAPEWVCALAGTCEKSSLRRVALILGVSAATVSLALNNKRGGFGFIKGRVESRIMATIRACPVLGVIGAAECLKRQGEPFTSANPLGIQLHRACRNGCPYFNGE